MYGKVKALNTEKAMNPANSLESALFENTKKALTAYRNMTGIGRPFHVPESFVQNFVALNVAKALGILILPEATRKKILEINRRKARGPIPANSKARYDLFAYFKSGRPWAAVEMKRANSLQRLDADKRKLKKFLSGAAGKRARRGYLLVFTGVKPSKIGKLWETKAMDSVDDRINDWGSKLDAYLVDSYVRFSRDDKTAIGIALYRLRNN